ncbi:hypothetical protein, partial [Mesorhizobium sp. M1A.F.Ca.IN.020.03.2.1]|uniref:hypothetical protein n=1 Tax=Mesorhizobium sp. M1A.F.Ca.IN.020.03.2.1 TaxID=2496769 RepID=UPI0019D446C6
RHQRCRQSANGHRLQSKTLARHETSPSSENPFGSSPDSIYPDEHNKKRIFRLCAVVRQDPTSPR